jgi:hypothetical protein
MLLSLVLVGGCTKKKTTAPTEPTFYLMKDYFPLNEGDQWTWEILWFYVTEPFVDGDSSWGEPFSDLNQNGDYDLGEPFEDVNHNGKYDGLFDPWAPGIPYTDRNSNGQYDKPNGIWDQGEFFLDLDYNGIGGTTNALTLNASILPSPIDSVIREGCFLGIYSDGVPGSVFGTRDIFSNDSLGLRWHGHLDRIHGYDFLADHGPITIAQESTSVGDSVVSGDTIYPYRDWVSSFEGVENITVPAGTFQSCLKFRSVASGWSYNMLIWEGISYQWYAKNIGLVKSEGPKQGQYWLLKSAKVGGRNYP